MQGKIYITLRSDLCAASGDGYSLAIDTDICADRYGLPFIPSRRLKGCLREAAVYIGSQKVDSIFGVSGESKTGTLRICDAQLEDFEQLRKQAEEKEYPAEKVLSLFTSVKASTAIENDTAKENTLRFMRVVNHYSPFKEGENFKENVFVSQIEYSPEDEEELKNICAALRNIGYKRSRGFDSVKCVFEPEKDSCKKVKINGSENAHGESICQLAFTVQLGSPAMFAGKTSVETADHIPGSAVLGAFADGYLKNGGDQSDFDRLFLSGEVRFSNMYITVDSKAALPAPAVLGVTKESSVPAYVFPEDNDTSKPLPKAFKGGYIIGRKLVKPEKEVIYHKGSSLYTQQCLCEGQLFTGTVSGKGSDIAKLLPLVESGRLNLGRSKSAQYSSCNVVAASCTVCKEQPLAAPGKVYALLCSDVLIADENAAFSTDKLKLANAIGGKGAEIDIEHSSLKYTTSMGYISVGRYKRPHIRAFEKGSVLCLNTTTNLPKIMTVGERQNEGFGVVRICTKDELMQLETAAPKKEQTTFAAQSSTLIDLFEEADRIEKLRTKAFAYADIKYKELKGLFNSSFLGRLLLMVSQAESFEDLKQRVASVKTESKREEALKFIQKKEDYTGDDWREFLKTALKVMKYRTKEDGADGS